MPLLGVLYGSQGVWCFRGDDLFYWISCLFLFLQHCGGWSSDWRVGETASLIGYTAQ